MSALAHLCWGVGKVRTCVWCGRKLDSEESGVYYLGEPSTDEHGRYGRSVTGWAHSVCHGKIVLANVQKYRTSEHDGEYYTKQIFEIVRLHRAGLSIRKVAAQLQTDRNRVFRVVRALSQLLTKHPMSLGRD
jgi:hypothetical protein